MYIHSPPTSIEHSLSKLHIYLSLRTDTYIQEHPSTVDSSPFWFKRCQNLAGDTSLIVDITLCPKDAKPITIPFSIIWTPLYCGQFFWSQQC